MISFWRRENRLFNFFRGGLIPIIKIKYHSGSISKKPIFRAFSSCRAGVDFPIYFGVQKKIFFLSRLCSSPKKEKGNDLYSTQKYIINKYKYYFYTSKSALHNNVRRYGRSKPHGQISNRELLWIFDREIIYNYRSCFVNIFSKTKPKNKRKKLK